MPSWKKVIVSGSDASFNSLYVLGGAISDGGFTGSLFGTASQAISASYAQTASVALSASYVPSLQQVVNNGNGIANFGGNGTASIQSTNFTSNRTLYLNDDNYPTIRIVDNLNASNNLQIDIDTLSLDDVSYNWSDIVSSTSSYAISASYALSASYAQTASYALAIPDQGFQYSTPTPLTTWTIIHNLDTLTPLVNVYDSSYYQIIPSQIIAIDANTVEIQFTVPRAGSAIVSKGSGISSMTAVSASFATTASYSISASYAENVRTVCYTAATSSATWTIPHNFGCKYVMVNVYNSSDDAIIPNRINLTDSNTTTIYFTVPTAGTALLIPANCCGTPTTTTTSTTTTTTTAAPTTTTSTTTSTTTTITPTTTTTSTTTSTTTAAYYTYTIYSSTGYSNAGDACTNQPIDTPSTVYAASNLIGSITSFYTDNTLTTPFVGGDQWWAFDDGLSVYRAQISNGGALSSNASC